eukprot:scaffold506957_cov19-Prasinocladus_malaysianus.AAC.1
MDGQMEAILDCSAFGHMQGGRKDWAGGENPSIHPCTRFFPDAWGTEWMDGWTDEQTDEWTNGRLDDWMDGQANKQMDGRMDKQTNELQDGWPSE